MSLSLVGQSDQAKSYPTNCRGQFASCRLRSPMATDDLDPANDAFAVVYAFL